MFSPPTSLWLLWIGSKLAFISCQTVEEILLCNNVSPASHHSYTRLVRDVYHNLLTQSGASRDKHLSSAVCIAREKWLRQICVVVFAGLTDVQSCSCSWTCGVWNSKVLKFCELCVFGFETLRTIWAYRTGVFSCLCTLWSPLCGWECSAQPFHRVSVVFFHHRILKIPFSLFCLLEHWCLLKLHNIANETRLRFR